MRMLGEPYLESVQLTPSHPSNAALGAGEELQNSKQAECHRLRLWALATVLPGRVAAFAILA